MSRINSIIKQAARHFGIEISKHLTPPDHDPVFDQWVSKLRSSGPIQVVFDVGANRGQRFARLRSEFPDAAIYAFEPGLSAFAELEKRTTNDAKAKLFQIAFGEHDGSASLHENADDVTNSLLTNSRHISEFAPPEMCVPIKTTSVPLMRIDTFCLKKSVERIDLLKIDAQGYERYILDGAGDFLSPSTIRSLFLEVLFVDLYQNQTWCGEVMELLRSRGYRFFGFTDIESDEINGWKWADALFIGNA